MLRAIKKWLRGLIRKVMPLPPPIRTIQQILDDLNGGPVGSLGALTVRPWVELPDIHAMLNAKTSGGNVNFDLGQGIIFKGFINTQTAEVKIYLAKALDVPNRDAL